MNLILGIVIVMGCVLGGFAFHGGELLALWQPSEIVIIGGAAMGAFVIANPFSVTKRALGGIASLIKGSPYKKAHYQALFAVMYDLLTVARKEGMMGLERVIEEPAKSEIFASISEETTLSKKQVSQVFDSLTSLVQKNMSRRGPGVFTLPGLVKLQKIHKPAVKARKGINPFTKEETMFKAKPARNVVKARCLKALKDMV